MIPVTQTLFGGEVGNCLPACVASILELGIDEVPNFCADKSDGSWLRKMSNWLADRGMCAVHAAWVEGDPGMKPDPEGLATLSEWLKLRRIGLAIVSGYTNRGMSHSTVWLDGRLVHDPHPSKDPLINVVDVVIIAHRDPVELAAATQQEKARADAAVRERDELVLAAANIGKELADDAELFAPHQVAGAMFRAGASLCVGSVRLQPNTKTGMSCAVDVDGRMMDVVAQWVDSPVSTNWVHMAADLQRERERLRAERDLATAEVERWKERADTFERRLSGLAKQLDDAADRRITARDKVRDARRRWGHEQAAMAYRAAAEHARATLRGDQ